MDDTKGYKHGHDSKNERNQKNNMRRQKLKEIGSDFWDVPTTRKKNNHFPESTQWFLSGRSALQAIIKDLNNCRTVAMPTWCCDSMIKPFIDAGIEVVFYSVYFDNGLVQEINFDSDVLFLMNYFGYTGIIPDLARYKGVVVRDITHSEFSYNYSDADYYFGSLRKWCGLWTGGYAVTNDRHVLETGETDESEYVSLRTQAMEIKREYIEDNRVDKSYLTIYNSAEDCLEAVGIAPAADRDTQLVERLDIELIRKRRRANAEVLISAFPDWLVFPALTSSDTPMFVPVLVPNGKRDELRRYLIKYDIYCPIHWPVSEYHKLTEKERFLFDNELSLVCDQRYTEEDMHRMVQIMKTFMEG